MEYQVQNSFFVVSSKYKNISNVSNELLKNLKFLRLIFRELNSAGCDKCE